MREGPSSQVLAGSFRWACTMSAWKGTTVLADDVPAVQAVLSVDGTQEVPERLTFVVPEVADGRSWVPDGPEHPLAHFGQFVDVDVSVWSSVTAGEAGVKETSTTRIGRFQIQEWEHNDVDGSVTVEAVGLLQRVKDARLRTPVSPRAGGTLASEFRRLMVAGIPVEFDAALVDRAAPLSFQWQEDRLGALYDIVDAWPARMRVDSFGILRVRPPLPNDPTPVFTFTDGRRGTLVSAPRGGTRDGIANVVVARSSATDDPSRAPVQAVKQVTGGPLAPATFGEVTFFWSSPLAATTAQLAASAQTILDRKSRPAIVRDVRAVPDPRLELDDPVSVTRDGVTETGYVVGYTLPLMVGQGPMSVTVGVGQSA